MYCPRAYNLLNQDKQKRKECFFFSLHPLLSVKVAQDAQEVWFRFSFSLLDIWFFFLFRWAVSSGRLDFFGGGSGVLKLTLPENISIKAINPFTVISFFLKKIKIKIKIFYFIMTGNLFKVPLWTRPCWEKPLMHNPASKSPQTKRIYVVISTYIPIIYEQIHLKSCVILF